MVAAMVRQVSWGSVEGQIEAAASIEDSQDDGVLSVHGENDRQAAPESRLMSSMRKELGQRRRSVQSRRAVEWQRRSSGILLNRSRHGDSRAHTGVQAAGYGSACAGRRLRGLSWIHTLGHGGVASLGNAGEVTPRPRQ